MKLLLVFTLIASAVSAPSSGDCCAEKKVGEILYKLFESGKDDETSKYGCKNGCVYVTGEDEVDKYCFKAGALPVKCLDFHWCYEGDCGPDKWGTAFEACNGKEQSPIDIKYAGGSPSAEPAAINFANYDKIRIEDFILTNSEEHYNGIPDRDRLEAGTVKNNGHTAQLDVVSTLNNEYGLLTGGPLGDDKFHILQLHFHWGTDDTKGSEHTLDGKEFPLEMHIVHKNLSAGDAILSSKGGLAVAGFFFEIDSADNPAISPIVDALEKIEKPDSKFDMAGSTFKITDLISGVAPLTPDDKYEYTNYDGSLTTPGCMEVVNWINFIKPLKISSAQLAKFRSIKDKNDKGIVDNFRPPQPLNGRVVTLYGK